MKEDVLRSEENFNLIYNEIKEVFPEAEDYIKEYDLVETSYTELIPILIKIVQEQQRIIEGQNTKISIQNKKIKTFKNLMTTLSKRLENFENS